MSDSHREMPIFTRAFDFLAWLTPMTQHFPRLHRHTITRRLVEAALDLQEALLIANNQRDGDRLAWLDRADAHLAQVRIYLRLAHRLHWLNMGQYQHGAGMVSEIGKLLGGWRKTTQSAVQRQN
ncbi:MAG: diversity-generating retroelement protein Avd [Caldilineaceae bacterium]|nr:diversity-generating retroelement protein Avd [Caldilineaceae bacterium]